MRSRCGCGTAAGQRLWHRFAIAVWRTRSGILHRRLRFAEFGDQEHHQRSRGQRHQDAAHRAAQTTQTASKHCAQARADSQASQRAEPLIAGRCRCCGRSRSGSLLRLLRSHRPLLAKAAAPAKTLGFSRCGK